MFYKDHKIDNISLDTRRVIIDWVLGNYCNYQCSYCFPGANTGTDRVPPLDDIMRNNVRHLVSELQRNSPDRKVLFTLSGGEPTLYHDIDSLIDFLKTLGAVGIITNGSRTIRWWESNGPKFYSAIISYHMHKAEYQHIADILNLLMNRVWLSVHVMVDPDLFNESIAVYDRLTEEFRNKPVNIQIKLLRDVSTNRSISYKPKHKRIINSIPYRKDVVPPLAETYRARIFMGFSDRDPVRFTPKEVINLTGDFTGYDCWAHHEFLQIDSKGRMGKFTCKQQYSDAVSIYDPLFPEQFSLSSDPIVCSTGNCGNLGLYHTTKKLVNK